MWILTTKIITSHTKRSFAERRTPRWGRCRLRFSRSSTGSQAAPRIFSRSRRTPSSRWAFAWKSESAFGSSAGEAGNSNADADAGESRRNPDRDRLDHSAQYVSAANAGASYSKRDQQQRRDSCRNDAALGNGEKGKRQNRDRGCEEVGT